MRVLVTGSSGLIGSALATHLEARGHEVLRLVRSKSALRPLDVAWDPEAGRLDPADLEGLDAVVHLAGENIGSGRWTASKKDRIRSSRVGGTALLAAALASLRRPPEALLCASAIGYYGDRGAELLTEESPPGRGFLPEVCTAWEGAAKPAADRGLRVAHVRIGVVLAGRGGALERMLPLFRMGLGGRLGDGRQSMSWIALEDVVGVFDRLLEDPSLKGPFNAVAGAATNAEFTAALARALHRPAVLPVPAFALRLALGQMADELLLSSTRVESKRLLEAGFVFRRAPLDVALTSVVTSR